jgi:hypothetical protein
VTERFDGLSQQTTYGASGAGPAEPVTSLTSVGVGQGSGQTATKQEANSMIAFEFPIRWDDISGALADLTDKKKLEQLVDDLTVRDNVLEDYLNTNIVSGIVAGSNITIDRATGVVTISSPNAVTTITAGAGITVSRTGGGVTVTSTAPPTSGTWTPGVSYNGLSASGSYYMVGQLMVFEALVFLTGTIVGANTINVSLPSGSYGETAGAVECFWGQGNWGTSMYHGTVLVGYTGLMSPYVVSGGGQMTDFANAYNGFAVGSALPYLKFRGAIRKLS